jgi:aspartyl protease family protein
MSPLKIIGSATLVVLIGLARVGALTQHHPTTPTPPPPEVHEAPLSNDGGGTKHVWGWINDDGNLPVNFVLDSGASDVVIPEKLAKQLLRTGALTAADYRGAVLARMADGRVVKHQAYVLHSLTVGHWVVTDVPVMVVAGNTAEPLLGQSFLSRFGRWAIDNNRSVLLLADR